MRKTLLLADMRNRRKYHKDIQIWNEVIANKIDVGSHFLLIEVENAAENHTASRPTRPYAHFLIPMTLHAYISFDGSLWGHHWII